MLACPAEASGTVMPIRSSAEGVGVAVAHAQQQALVLTHHGSDGEPIIVLSGRLGINSVGRLRDTVMTVREQVQDVLCVDASRVRSIDAAGWRTLIACRRLVAA